MIVLFCLSFLCHRFGSVSPIIQALIKHNNLSEKVILIPGKVEEVCDEHFTLNVFLLVKI